MGFTSSVKLLPELLHVGFERQISRLAAFASVLCREKTFGTGKGRNGYRREVEKACFFNSVLPGDALLYEHKHRGGRIEPASYCSKGAIHGLYRNYIYELVFPHRFFF